MLERNNYFLLCENDSRTQGFTMKRTQVAMRQKDNERKLQSCEVALLQTEGKRCVEKKRL